MGITSDELKTIAATSAIAAAGGALATALVTYAVDRWIFKSEAEEGPTFVVVPVVERPVPPEVVDPQPPLIAGYGQPFGASPGVQLDAGTVLMVLAGGGVVALVLAGVFD
jgi:hypothetical protein